MEESALIGNNGSMTNLQKSIKNIRKITKILKTYLKVDSMSSGIILDSNGLSVSRHGLVLTSIR